MHTPSAESVAGPTVLVVEDDVLVRLDLAEELRARGVAVIEAGDAHQATKVLESGWRIDLVVSDVQMPGAMDGFGLAAWIWLRRPAVKVMLTSAHFQAARRAGLDGDATFVEKPYRTDAVASRIVQDLKPPACE
ncbi:MAG: response regulator [Dongiaceae bacterium]